MATQKIYKVRQHFRKLLLRLLNLENLLIYCIHESGRLEYQDFKNNYITDILEVNRCQQLDLAMSN